MLIKLAVNVSCEKVERLLTHGANVNAADDVGDTALHCVVQRGRVDVAALLLGKGADIEARNKNGYTPLIMAVFHGELRCVELLLDRGAKINAVCNDGFTALNCAAQEHFSKSSCGCSSCAAPTSSAVLSTARRH